MQRSEWTGMAVTGVGLLVYVAALLASPLLAGQWLALSAAAWAVLLGATARHGRIDPTPAHLAAWPPFHLVLLALGSATAPALPLVALWSAAAGILYRLRVAAAAVLAAGALLLFGEWWARRLDAFGAVEAGLTLAVGLLLGYVGDRIRRRGVAAGAELHLIREEARLGRRATDALSVAARRLDELRQSLDFVRSGLGVWRVVLWDVSAEAERARPRVAIGGPTPPEVALFGSPLRLVWMEGGPLVLDHPPTWGREGDRFGAVAVTPMGGRSALLTVESAGPQEILRSALEDAAHYLRVFVAMQEREAQAEARRERLDQIMSFLKRLPGDVEPDAFPAELARAAADVAGGTGAAVARWRGDTGQISAIVGTDGGPASGTYVRAQDSELGLSARAGSVIHRDRRASGMLPLAAPEERWIHEPRSLVTIPLHDAAGQVWGIIGVWSSTGQRLDADAVDLFRALAPLLAVQLQHAGDIVELREQVQQDALTGLYNRGAFDERLEKEQVHFQRYRRPAALIVADLDHFKAVNDTYGHEAGDAVLRILGSVVQQAIRDVDFAARYGGEEIVILLPETMRTQAVRVAERLRQAIEDRPLQFHDRTIQVRASFGVSACPECAEDPAHLLPSADAMLYEAKRGGRNQVRAAPIVGAAEPASAELKDAAEG